MIPLNFHMGTPNSVSNLSSLFPKSRLGSFSRDPGYPLACHLWFVIWHVPGRSASREVLNPKS